MRRVRTRGRHGYTLVEMLVVMFVFTTFLGVCVALVELLLKLDDRGQAHEEALATTARMARTFREDIHAAFLAEPIAAAGGASGRIALAGPEGRRIEYRVAKGLLIREERQDDAFRRTDTFPLPTRTGRLVIEPGEGRPLVAIVFDHRSARNRGRPQELRIEAALGTDHRFGNSDEEPDEKP